MADSILWMDWNPIWGTSSGPCEEALYLATLLMMNDPVFAAEMVSLIGEKSQIEALIKAWAKSEKIWNQEIHLIDEKINLFIEHKLLAWKWTFYNLWDEAKSKLIAQLRKDWYEIDRAKWVLDAISNTELENWDVLSLIIANWDQTNAETLVNDLNRTLSKYIIAKDKMRLVQWIKREVSDAIANLKRSFTNTMAKMWDDMNNRLWATLSDEAWDVGWITAKTSNIEQPPLFKRDVPWTDDYDNLTLQEARDTVYQYFDSDEVSVVFADNLTTPEGQAAMWAYLDRMIYFASNVNIKKWTPEHEVVHAYIDLFLTREEKWALYYDALDWHIDEIREYMKVNWQSTLREATEDWIADWFVRYLQRKQTFTWKLKDFFDELWYRIKKIFGNEDQVRKLYKDIENKKRPTWRWPRRYSYDELATRQNSLWLPVTKEMDKFMRDTRATVWEEVWWDLVVVYHTSDSPLVYDSLKEWIEWEWIYWTSNQKMSASYAWWRQRKFVDQWNKVTKSQQIKNFTNQLNETWENVPRYREMQEKLWMPRISVVDDTYHIITSWWLTHHYFLKWPWTWGATLQNLYWYRNWSLSYISERLNKFFDKYKQWDFGTLSLVHQDVRYSKITKNDLKKIIAESSTVEEAQERLALKLEEYAKKNVVREKYRTIDDMVKNFNDWSETYVNEYRWYVNMKNPLILENNRKKNRAHLSIEWHPELWDNLKTRQVAVWARENWYDWVIIKEIMDTWWWEFWYQFWDVYIWFKQSQFKHIENRAPTSDKRMFFKRAVDDQESKITPAKINKDPAFQYEYQSRINTIKTLQTMIADDIDRLRNTNIWVFAVKDWLFWDMKVKEMWDDIKEMSRMYWLEWEDTLEMTLSELRNRIEETRMRFKDAHRQKNVIASMVADREKKNKEMLKIYEMPKVKKKRPEPVWATTRRSMNSIIKHEYRENEVPEPKKTFKIDPMDKKTLPPEAEKVLKENIVKDVEQVKNWEAPSNLVKADEVWKEFYEMSDKAKEREFLLNNYLIWKIYLWEWDDALESALKWLSGKNLDWYTELTLDQINSITSLSQLEQVVYTHIWDLIYDKALRQALKDKQYELWTTVSEQDAKTQAQILSKTRSIQKTSEFLQAWWLYTDVTLYDRVWRTLKWLFPWEDWIAKNYDNRKLYDEFTTAITNFNSNKATSASVWWVVMSANDLVKWLYAISRDDVATETLKWQWNPLDKLKVSAKKLFNIWTEKDAKEAQKRIDDLFNSITPQDLKGANVTKMAYTTISDVKIGDDMTDENVIFYNYRDWLYAWQPQTTYWQFYDEISRQNSLVIDADHDMKEAFTISEIPTTTKYIVVNDINRRDDKELADLVDFWFPEWQAPQVIYPRRGMEWNFYVENWKLKFRTISNKWYNEITRNISAKTLWAFSQNIEQVTKESMKDLENTALEYFRTMMWLDMKWAPKNKAEYKEWIISNLRMITWLPISAEMDVYNPQSTWKMASDIIRYQLWATWRYTKVIKDVEQVIADISSAYANNRDVLFNEIKNLVGWDDEIMARNADAIRDAYIQYATAQTIEAKIQAKWTLMALCNWWEYSKITVELFNGAIREDDIIWTLWPIIYWNREYTKDEQLALTKLWDDILASYTFNFGSNLISQWYSMVLISPSSAIRKFLRWEPIMNDWFVQAFIKKNDLPENASVINGIFKDAMPSDIWIELPWPLLTSPDIEVPNVVVDEVPNVIIPTNYNQLSAIIAKWKTSEWGWITWEEEAIIKNILDNYYRVVELNVEAWTMTPTLAQQLKLQAWWALDMVEQDLVMTKYSSFLSLEERNWLMWGKYKLRIATTKDELADVKRWNDDIIAWYRRRLWDMGKDWIKIYNNIDQAKKDLIEKGKIMTKIDGKIVTMNVHDMLVQQLETLPEWLRWIFNSFKWLTKNDIRWLPYQQAYAIIKAIDLAKNASARWNLYFRLMYKQNPSLANIDFFRRYQLNSDWVPMALANNAAKLVDSTISDWLDTYLKQSIMLDISQVMKKRWKITDAELEDIVTKNLAWFNKEDIIKNHYTNMFKAYTYLTDIPKDIKNTINGMLDTQLKEVRKDLTSEWEDFYEWLLNSRIVLSDWNEVTLRDILAWDIDAYKPNLFIEKWEDWVYSNVTMKETTSSEMWLTESQKIDYSDAMFSMINDLDQVTDSERKLTTVLFNNARKILSKFTTTKKILDADYFIWGQNDLLKNLIKANAFSWWWQLWWEWDLISKGWNMITWQSLFNKENWDTIRNYYYTYYWQPLEVLEKMEVSNDLQATALEMAIYFKKIENILGSEDWALWASIDTKLNRAFWRLWTVVLRVNTATEVHNLMNLIANNQILWMFKFAREWDWAYFDLFSNIKTSKQKFTSVQYIRDLEVSDLKRFNEVFNSDYSMDEFKIIMQALWWYQLWTPARAWLNTIMRWINSSSVLARALMSYPFQLFTIAPQSIAYNFKANAYKRWLWIENMAEVNASREWRDVLTSDYIEWNPTSWARWKIKNWLKRYTWKDVQDAMVQENVEMDDWLMDLFWKSYDHARKNYTWEQILQLFDATRDNANNIIDALMAQRFKNLAYVKALQTNNVITFNNVESFERFMNDVSVPQELKDKVMSSIRVYSWRIFKDMLWTWFSWLDKVYASTAVWEVLVWLMNAVNFRWAWWLNMFRQTFEKIISAFKTFRFVWDWRARHQAVDYIARTPEFSNLSQAMFNDLVWMWKLARFSDNGKQPDDESEADIMDFVEWMWSNIELVSQQWQWLMSFWPTRLIQAPVEAAFRHWNHPEFYWPDAWIWAFLQTFVSNFWRNRKPWNFMASALVAAQADWDMWRVWDYIADNFYTLSAWTLRYMLEEWYNAYWANTPLVYEIWWIPSAIAWEQWEGSDTAFLYQMRQEETAYYLTHLWDEWYSFGWLLSQLANYSQLFSFMKQSIRWAWYMLWKEDWKSSKSTYDLSDMDEAYADLPEWQEWRKYWFIMPKHEEWYETYYDAIVNYFTNSKAPWGSNFYKWVSNFLLYWHINGKSEWSYYDKQLEEFFTRIQEKDPGALKDLVSNEKLMAEVASDTKKSIQTSLSFMEKELALFDWDPEYNKYASLLYKWIMSNVMYDELEAFADEKTQEYRNKWRYDKKQKISASEIRNKMPALYQEFKQQFVDEHWDDLRVADSESMENAMFNFLAKKWSEATDMFFDKKTFTDDDWNEVDRYYLKSNLKSQVKQLIDFEAAMNEWERERAVIEWTALTKTFSYDHTVSPEVAFHIFNRINNSTTLTDKEKLEAMTEFVSNNLDAFTPDSEFAKENPELWEEAKWHYNEIVYQVNSELIQKANDYALSLESDSEKDSKWWGWLAWNVVKLSNKLAKIQQQTAWSSWWGNWKTTSMTWVKAPILDPSNIINEYSKVPQIDFNPKFTSKWYTPKTDLWWGSKQQPTAKPVKVKKVKVKEKDIEVI